VERVRGRRWLITGRRWAVAGLILIVMLNGCGTTSNPAAATAPATTTATDEPPGLAPAAPCADGLLRVGDLPAIDASWRQGLDDATRIAHAWQADARLVSFQVGCQILAPGFRWRVTFYSPSLQLFFTSDTGATTPAETDPSKIPTLPTDGISFLTLRRALLKNGYPDTTEISPVDGVDVRLNTSDDPFGPPNAPTGVVYFHVAVIANGETKDLFVSAVDGTIYRYNAP